MDVTINLSTAESPVKMENLLKLPFRYSDTLGVAMQPCWGQNTPHLASIRCQSNKHYENNNKSVAVELARWRADLLGE